MAAGDKALWSDVASIIPAIDVKGAVTSRASTIAIADDPDLSAIPIGVGTWEIEVVLFFTATTGDFKNAWAFTGGWTVGNRACLGPSPNIELQDHQDTNMVNVARAFTTTQSYGHNSATAWAVVRESAIVVVSAAGNFSIQWAQETSDVSATALQPSSYVRVTKVV